MLHRKRYKRGLITSSVAGVTGPESPKASAGGLLIAGRVVVLAEATSKAERHS